MASPNNSIKIHEHCLVSPPPSSSTTHFSLPLTFFDLFWLRFFPSERIFFYSLPNIDPSFFYHKLVPKLKLSLSLTLQKFLPLSGKIIWPSHSPKPIIQYNPGDGVSLLIAESNADFNNHVLNNSPRDAVESRFLIPHLDSSDSHASAISLQITLFPNSGFCIGVSALHAVLDGKSSTMFVKAWAALSQKTDEEESPPSLEPFFDRDVIKDPTHLDIFYTNNWIEQDTTSDSGRSLKILSNRFEPNLENSVRATFELSRADLENLKKKVLSKWDTVVEVNDEVNSQSINSSSSSSKQPHPHALSSFVVASAYVYICISKAIRENEKNEQQKFAFRFPVDCRSRLEPPVPENYFGNCVHLHTVDFTKEDDGLLIVVKKIVGKIKMLENDVLDGVETLFSKQEAMVSSGVKVIGVGGSSRFGVYEADFGWGRPAKVEATSVDRGLIIGMAESKDGKGGIEVGLVLKKDVMDIFSNLFHAEL